MSRFAVKIAELMRKREFVSVATCDFDNRPNAAPKFVLKMTKDFIYLVDYSRGRTLRNLEINPRASLSFVDFKSLNGYQINGSVKIIRKGPEYNKLYKETLEKNVSLTAKHIIEEVRGGEERDNFEISRPDKFVIFKVRLEGVAEIGTSGKIKRHIIASSRG